MVTKYCINFFYNLLKKNVFGPLEEQGEKTSHRNNMQLELFFYIDHDYHLVANKVIALKLPQVALKNVLCLYCHRISKDININK